MVGDLDTGAPLAGNADWVQNFCIVEFDLAAPAIIQRRLVPPEIRVYRSPCGRASSGGSRRTGCRCTVRICTPAAKTSISWKTHDPERGHCPRLPRREGAGGARHGLDGLRVAEPEPQLPRAATWSFDAFTHGDLKFENCVVSTDGVADGAADRAGADPGIRIVDWELADFGDPCWDAGCVVQAYLYVCLRDFLDRRGERLRERLGRAGARAEAMRGALDAFRTGCAAGLDLERVMGCAAARLLQMALEVMHGQEEPPPLALSLLDAGEEVLEDPRETARLLGLKE
jgi:hypothetical protein